MSDMRPSPRHTCGLADYGLMNQELAIALLTDVKVALVLVPKAVMAIRHTTMISANMTAYSTAVGPSSWAKKRTSQRAD